MVKKKELQRTGILAAKEMLQMDFIADEFAISNDTGNLHLLDFPTRTNDLIFGICHAGFIEIEIDLKRIMLSANHLIVLFPEQIVRFISKSEDFSAQFVVMSNKFISDSQVGLLQKLPLFFYIKEHPNTRLSNEEMTVVADYLSLLQKKMRMTNNSRRRDIILYLMQAFFMKELIFSRNICLPKPENQGKKKYLICLSSW
jgi:hypothetical protein